MDVELKPVVFDVKVYKEAMGRLETGVNGCCLAICGPSTKKSLHMALLAALVKPNKLSNQNFWWPTLPWGSFLDCDFEEKSFSFQTPRIIALQLAIEAVKDMPKTVEEANMRGFYRLAVVLQALELSLNILNYRGLCGAIGRLYNSTRIHSFYLPDAVDDVSKLCDLHGKRYRKKGMNPMKYGGYWWPNEEAFKGTIRKQVLKELACWAYIADIRIPL